MKQIAFRGGHPAAISTGAGAQPRLNLKSVVAAIDADFVDSVGFTENGEQ